jgi:diguanylate cyclase (GGDEF)-like protein
MARRSESANGAEARVYHATRALFPRSYAARIATFAGLAAFGPLAALALSLWLLGAGAAFWFALFGGAAITAAAGVAAIRALAAPIERIGAELGAFAPAPETARTPDAVERIARGVEALSRRLEAATRRGDPTRLDDPLTGLPNRLAAMRRGRDEITRARRKGEPLAAALLTFRDPADAESGEGLDIALRCAAEQLAQGLRAYDVIARWDGPQFVAILPEAEVEHAVAALRRIGEDLEVLLRRRGYGDGFEMIGGVAVLQPDDATLADIAARAEAALTRARAGSGQPIAAAPGPRTRPANLSSV